MLALREQRRQADPGIQVATLAPGPVTRMEPIPDGSTYAARPAAAPVQTQLASLGPNVIRMEPIPDGSTYSREPAPPPANVVARMDPIPDGSTYRRETYSREPAPVVVARMDPIPDPPARPMALAAAEARPAMPFERAGPRGFSFVAPAQAGTLPAPMASPMTRQGGLPPGVLRAGIPAAPAPGGPLNQGWAIQVGAFASENLARDAAGQARDGAGGGRATVMAVAQGRGTLYRARVTGLSRDAAQGACGRVRGSCMVVSPEG